MRNVFVLPFVGRTFQHAFSGRVFVVDDIRRGHGRKAQLYEHFIDISKSNGVVRRMQESKRRLKDVKF